MTTVALRPYQGRAVERLRDHIRAGVRRLLLVSPTGSGKTTIAGHLIVSAVARGRRILFVAHRRELITQAYKRVIHMGVPEDAVGLVMGQDARRRPGAPVQVASIDTLRHRAKPLADIVFRDEAHRALSKTDRELAAQYPSAIHIGLTATPYRSDGRGLGEAYDVLVLVAQPKELIADGYLVAPRVFTVPDNSLPDLKGIRTRGGDYDEAALARAVDRSVLVGNIVEHWQKHAHGVATVAFAASVQHSLHIAERFNDVGIHAEQLDGETPVDERDAMLRRLDTGETSVVSNCGVLCEGWDQPTVKCAILARPTKSTGLYLQQAGRILRPWNDQRAIILDHGGCAVEHGLPQDEREYTLGDPKRKRGSRGESEPVVRICVECQAVLPIGERTCPECGYAFENTPVPSEQAGELVEVTDTSETILQTERVRALTAARKRTASPAVKRAYFDFLLETEPSAEWALARYRIELREQPPEGT